MNYDADTMVKQIGDYMRSEEGQKTLRENMAAADETNEALRRAEQVNWERSVSYTHLRAHET